MEELNESDDLKFKHMFDELKLDDLSTSFEANFQQLERKRKFKQVLKFFGIGTVLVFIASTIYFTQTNPSSLKPNSDSTSSYTTTENYSATSINTDTTKTLNPSNKKQQHSESEALQETILLPSITDNTTPNAEREVSTPLTTNKESYIIASKENLSTNSPSPLVNPCEGINIKVEYKTTATCANKADGQIELTKVQGGTAPYQYKINNMAWSTLKVFKYLDAGNHTIQISDANHCNSQAISISIEEEACINENELVYSLSKDNDIRIPLQEQSLLKILDNRGNVLIQRSGKEHTEFVFNANTINQPLREGLYILIITTPSGRQLKYDITVLP